jgi:PAS domain S-box-containing protein
MVGFFAAGISAVFVLARNSRDMLNRVFFFYSCTVALFNLLESLALITRNHALADIFLNIAVFIFILLATSLFHFLLVFSGKERIWKNPIFYLINYLPALMFGYLSWATGKFYVGVENTVWGFRHTYGEYFWFLALYSVAYLLASLYLAWDIRRGKASRRVRSQGSLIFTGLLIAVTSGVFFDVFLPQLGIHYVTMIPTALVVFILFFTAAMARYGLMIMTPEAISRSIIDTMPGLLLVIDDSRNILLVNNSFVRNTGYTMRETIGRPVKGILSREIAEEMCDTIYAAGREGTVLTGYRGAVITKFNTRLPVSINAVLLKDNLGEGVGCLLIMRDISKEEQLLAEQKRIIDELSKNRERMLSILEDTAAARDLAYQKSKEISELYEKLKVADLMKTEFLSIVSHELRTPLVPIIGYTDLLLSEETGKLSEKQVQFLKSIQKESNHLHELVDSVLDVSRIESGKPIELSKSQVSIKVLLEELLELIQPKIRTEIDIPDGFPILNVDPVKIKRVFNNLIGNALKFTPKDGTIRITGEKKDGFVELRVIDNGAGISKEHLTAIFEKYCQVGTPQSGIKTGVGLGLTIAKELVESHGGKIWAESEGPGKGSRLIFTLPLTD